jgi:anti-sigma B factor antagonist
MGAGDQLQVAVRRDPGRAVLLLAGELDMASVEILQRALDADDLRRERMIVLDLEQLDFIDSMGLRSILAAREQCQDRQQEFAITPGSPQVQRLLRITGVEDRLPTIAATNKSSS